MQFKVPGISLLLSLGVSLLMVLMALGLLSSLERSFEREITVERSLQFYYALEGGIENALFHKNARGKGTHMPGNSEQVLDDSAESALKTTWEIDAQENPLSGLLREGDSLEIPLSIPKSIDIENDKFEEKTQNLSSNDSFILQVYKSTDDMPAEVKTSFESRFGRIDFKNVSFPESSNPLIGWHISRTDKTTGKKELFRPPNAEEGSLCGNALDSDKISFRLCPEDLNSNTNQSWTTLDSTSDGLGRKEGLNNADVEMIGLQDFLDFKGNFDFKIHLFTLGSFEGATSEGAKKIEGIPFSLTLNSRAESSSEGFGSDFFTINATVQEGSDFAREVEIKLPEKAPNTLFNYIILE